MEDSRPLLSGQTNFISDSSTRGRQTLFQRATAARTAITHIFSNPRHQLAAFGFLMYLFAEFGALVLEVPCARLFERTVCRRYYRSFPATSGFLGSLDEIDEHLCKLPSIQREVATLVGWRDSLLALPTLVTAIFYGFCADKYGRKPVLLLAVIGELLVVVWIVIICNYDSIFPTRLSWASAIFLLIGGGHRVTISMIYAMTADVVDRSYRTRYMYLFQIGNRLAGILWPPIEAFTMSQSVWLPFQVAILVYLFMLLMICWVPETREKMVMSPHSGSDFEEEHERNNIQDPVSPIILFKGPNLLLCFLLFFMKRVGFTSEILFYQHASTKFDLQLRQTSWFRLVSCVSAIFVLAVILPSITKVLRRRNIPIQVIDLTILRGGLATMIVSFFVVYIALTSCTFSFGVLLCGAGSGIDPGIPGLASTFVSSAHRAKMFTLLAMIDSFGRLLASPLMAVLYAFRMDDVGRSAGLCFLASSILWALALGISFGIKLSF